jgi:beta-glucanase (GH16 family)
MRKFLLLALFIVLLASVSSAQEWKLVWSDEFNYEGLPDPTKWDYEEGFIRNHESQYYTRGRKENARVENGMLIIEARKESFPNARFNPNATRGPATRPSADYTSASLVTRGKARWTYGRIEVRAKLPEGRGVWPAIWMLGADQRRTHWPACGEIDIMEFIGRIPDLVHATVHFQKDGRHGSSGSTLHVDKPFDDFHVYSVEWTPQKMDFYFDDRKYHSFNVADADENGQNPFHKPQYLILNLALGGDWGQAIDDSKLPQNLLIDYVRVYQRETPVPAAGK